MRSLLGTVIWVVGYFLSLLYVCLAIPSWPGEFLLKETVILMGIPLCVICCFSLAAFNIFSLCLILINSINMCLGVFHFEFTLFETLWVSWTWVAISFPILGEFSTIISSGVFSWPFFLSSSGTSMIRMLGDLTYPRGL